MTYEEIYKNKVARLTDAYLQWTDYEYKPSQEAFIRLAWDCFCYEEEFCEQLERICGDAYYSGIYSIAHPAFDKLACWIHFARTFRVDTPYDHVIRNASLDFETILNGLHPLGKCTRTDLYCQAPRMPRSGCECRWRMFNRLFNQQRQ